jgi:hypothetical protein
MLTPDQANIVAEELLAKERAKTRRSSGCVPFIFRSVDSRRLARRQEYELFRRVVANGGPMGDWRSFCAYSVYLMVVVVLWSLWEQGQFDERFPVLLGTLVAPICLGVMLFRRRLARGARAVVVRGE